MKYVFEHGVSMPLCAVVGNLYFDYLTGKQIKKESVLEFIKKGLERKTMAVVELDLSVYKIVGEGVYLLDSTQTRPFTVGYIFYMNGYANYLDRRKQPFNRFEKEAVRERLMNGKFKEELVWG